MEIASGIKAYARYDIDQEASELRYRGDGTTEKWRRDLFEEFWMGVDDSKLLGSDHEVRYAEGIKELIYTLGDEDPAPAGFSFYWPYSYGRYKRHVNRVYRARYPILEDASLSPSEITEAAEREKTILLRESEATSIFGEIVDQDFEHVHPVSDTCVIKPKEAQEGLYRIVYDPRQVKTLRTRHVNDARKEKERQAVEEKERAERMAAKQREYERRQRWKERQSYLLPVANLLEWYLERKLDEGIVRIAPSNLSGEPALVEYILAALSVCDKIVGASAIECLDTHSLAYKQLRKSNTGAGAKSIGSRVSRLMQDPDKYLFAYADPLRNRNEFPQGSGILAEMPKEDPKGDKKYAELYKRLYNRLKQVATGVQIRKKTRKNSRNLGRKIA